MGLDQSNPNKPATADTSIQWPDSHKWDEVEYGLHQDVLNSNSGKQKMRRFRTGQDLSLQDFWKDKRRRGYGAGPARRAQRKLQPFILSNYGRWLDPGPAESVRISKSPQPAGWRTKVCPDEFDVLERSWPPPPKMVAGEVRYFCGAHRPPGVTQA